MADIDDLRDEIDHLNASYRDRVRDLDLERGLTRILVKRAQLAELRLIHLAELQTHAGGACDICTNIRDWLMDQYPPDP